MCATNRRADRPGHNQRHLPATSCRGCRPVQHWQLRTMSRGDRCLRRIAKSHVSKACLLACALQTRAPARAACSRQKGQRQGSHLQQVQPAVQALRGLRQVIEVERGRGSGASSFCNARSTLHLLFDQEVPPRRPFEWRKKWEKVGTADGLQDSGWRWAAAAALAAARRALPCPRPPALDAHS